MKKRSLWRYGFIVSVMLASPVLAQSVPATQPLQRHGDTPQLLKGPADWRLEILDVPIVFAPDIALRGWEEVRFSPGVFDAASPNHFTYAFAISASAIHEWHAADVKDFLEKYYRGLSVFGGKKADLSQVRVDLAPASEPEHGDDYIAKVAFFDQFTDGRLITVRIEIKLFNQSATNRFYIVALISPKAVESSQWQALHNISKAAVANILSNKASK